jgi:hypothetical protein
MAKIVEAYGSALVLGAHYFWVKMDDAGQVTGQINGWQVDSNGKINTTSLGGHLIADTEFGTPFDSDTARATQVEGSQEKIDAMWAAGLECAGEINKLDISYNMFTAFGGHNRATQSFQQ